MFFISFLENKELYPFSRPVLRTSVTIQSIPADCIRRTALPESLCVPLAYVHRLHHSQSSSGLPSWENDQGLASFCSK